MCGRFTLRATPEQLAEAFAVLRAPDLVPRQNISPTQTVAVVRAAGPDGSRELAMLRWGLIPSWAKDTKIGATLINARAETAATKPSFRAALKQRRCLIPADGFYEWQAVPGSKKKQPLWIRLKDANLFAFAGLWERWTDPAGTPLESCTILTTGANELLSPIHDRMPVILDRASYGRWLDPAVRDAAQVSDLFQSYPAEKMEYTPVAPDIKAP